MQFHTVKCFLSFLWCPTGTYNYTKCISWLIGTLVYPEVSLLQTYYKTKSVWSQCSIPNKKVLHIKTTLFLSTTARFFSGKESIFFAKKSGHTQYSRMACQTYAFLEKASILLSKGKILPSGGASIDSKQQSMGYSVQPKVFFSLQQQASILITKSHSKTAVVAKYFHCHMC